MNPLRIVTLALSCLSFCLLLPQAALAQAWPAKPIRFIVSFPPGGSADIIARALAQKLSEPGSLGQQVLVDNRAGAGGNIGVDLAAKTAPDGYTIVLGAAGAIAINQSLMGGLPYDPQKDLAPISLLATIPIVLAVHPSTPANSVRELIALARSKPLAFASAGNGTAMHLSGELFKLKAGLDLQHVPYKGSGPAVTDLMGGQVPVAIQNAGAIMPLVRDGRLRGLAVTSLKRSEDTSNLPTVDESGFEGFEAGSWFALLAPAGTSPAIVEKVRAESLKVLADPEMMKKFAALGLQAVGSTPEQTHATIAADIPKWVQVVKEAHITLGN